MDYPENCLSKEVDETSSSTSTASKEVANTSSVFLRGQSMCSLLIDGKERICLAQISNTLLRKYSYNEIHNRRVALGINCVQCTPSQLEMLREAGAMPVSSRRCGMITNKEAERLVKSFLDEQKPPSLPESFTFKVQHKCAYGCRGTFFPSRYNSSRAKCIRCTKCMQFFSPNKFIFHSHESQDATFNQTGSINFNSWRRHITLINPQNDEDINNAWEDVKSIFNSGKRRRSKNKALTNSNSMFYANESSSSDSDESYSANKTTDFILNESLSSSQTLEEDNNDELLIKNENVQVKQSNLKKTKSDSLDVTCFHPSHSPQTIFPQFPAVASPLFNLNFNPFFYALTNYYQLARFLPEYNEMNKINTEILNLNSDSNQVNRAKNPLDLLCNQESNKSIQIAQSTQNSKGIMVKKESKKLFFSISEHLE
jgi:hypothetical protein